MGMERRWWNVEEEEMRMMMWERELGRQWRGRRARKKGWEVEEFHDLETEEKRRRGLVMGSFVRILEDYDVFLQAVEEEEDYDHQEKWRDITIIFCGNFLVYAAEPATGLLSISDYLKCSLSPPIVTHRPSPKLLIRCRRYSSSSQPSISDPSTLESIFIQRRADDDSGHLGSVVSR
ncbi:hypothetical protein Csa_008587 [Cucumis sativus]|nr:hypothetical protein Csa_008587 [Cucumis sativus]